VQRVFALPQAITLFTIARRADATLAAQGWYLLMPDDLDERFSNPQVIVWQREPDQRLDLTQLWPLSGMSRTERLYGGTFPPEFLDARCAARPVTTTTAPARSSARRAPRR
jgi:hypothetical protein